MKQSALRIMGMIIILTFFSAAVGMGGVSGCGEGKDTAVAAEIVLADGTEKGLSDAPIPVNIFIKLTFTGAVNTTEAESKLIFTKDDVQVPRTITWLEDNTEMLVRPKNVLTYGTQYRVAMNPEQVQKPLEAPTTTAKATIAAIDETFTTMVRHDVNGDGKADVITQARTWQGGSVAEGGSGRGRGYIFYGNDLATVGAASADAIIDGETDNDELLSLRTFSPNSDVNDDGFEDVIYQSFNYGARMGRTYIFYGGSEDEPISGALSVANADIILTGNNSDDFFIASSVGDVNGDGFSDIIGGGRGCSNNMGCVYLFFGPDVASATVAAANVTITGENEDDDFGTSIRLGDVNDDGIADIVVSAPGYPNGAGNGRIYVFYGSKTFASIAAANADVMITGEAAGDGLMAYGLADFDGDGVGDIVAAAPSNDGARGRLYVFYHAGLASKNAGEADVILTGENAGDHFGFVSGWDDVTGDGSLDIITCALDYGTGGGRVYGFLGDAGFGSEGAQGADFMITGESAGDGMTFGDVGDVNGDGIADMVMSAANYAGGASQGRVYIIFGGASIASRGAADADVVLTGETNGDDFAFLRLIDVNGDGVMDVVGNATSYNGGALTGRIYLFYGGDELLSRDAASADVILTGENPLDRFGF